GKRRPRPERAQELDLLLESPTAIAERHAERLVFDRVPALPDAEAKPAAGEEVDLDGLLREERRLALRGDHDPRRELGRRGGRREVAAEDEGLVERVVHRERPRARILRVGL